MIRGNWSLANDLKNVERKQQHKTQQKQKHKKNLEKLYLVDPIRLYYQIEKLKKSDTQDSTRLKSLQEDWDFIIKHKLHKQKLDPFLADLEAKNAQKLIREAKLHGAKSAYFNPELNPLGKVPQVDGTNLPNLTLPLKSKFTYETDPVIASLNVVFPQGDPPRFYKMVQNAERNVKLLENEASDTKPFIPSSLLKRRKPQEETDDDYRHESKLAPEEEEYLERKKSKLETT